MAESENSAGGVNHQWLACGERNSRERVCRISIFANKPRFRNVLKRLF